jgi:radical SAM superfamily enzyme YgiQ (UPF0313 family)
LGPLPTDHPEIIDITEYILKEKKKFSFSSVRIGALSEELISNLKLSGENTITLAPETGSEQLRKKINKPITNRAIFSQIERIAQKGLKKVKLYFIIGLPFETDDDVTSISRLINELTESFPGIFFSVSLGIFVPKPHTVFQWAQFLEEDVIKKRIKILKSSVHFCKNLSLEISPVKTALLEAMLSSGGIDLSRELIKVMEKSNRSNILQRIDFRKYVYIKKDYKKFFFWDIIVNQINRENLLNEYESLL